jgi:hypothetical protein
MYYERYFGGRVNLGMSSRKKFKVGDFLTLRIVEANNQFAKYNNTKVELLECVPMKSKDDKGSPKYAYFIQTHDNFKFHAFDGELC